MREIIFDTETTGLDPFTGDRVVEIGCIEIINRVESGATYHCYFNPERTMPAGAQEVHGLSDTFLSNKPLFADKAAELLEFLGDAPLVAHNAAFDFKFLNFELEKCGLTPIGGDRMVDTLALARAKHGQGRMSLDALCTRYGIDRSHRTKHGALLDAELLTQVYVELTGGRQIGLVLSESDGSINSQNAATEQDATIPERGERPYREPRIHHASEAELQRHAAFVKNIDNALWAGGRRGG